MAWVKANQPGRRAGLQYEIANLDGLQDHLDAVVFEARVRAEEEVATIRASEQYTGDWHVEIEVERGDIDRYLILNDENGQRAALSIEFGREPYYMAVDGSGSDGNSGSGQMRRVEGMEGKGILHKAFGLRAGQLRGTGGGSL